MVNILTEKAIFLDRDGTIIDLVNNEPARTPDQVEFSAYAVEFMKQAQEKGFKLFVISNQPDLAKGKQNAESLLDVHKRFEKMVTDNGIIIQSYYYCLHHPEGNHKKYTKVCSCRKPAPGFIQHAAECHNLNLHRSWIVGDKDTDLICGKNAGINGIRINGTHSLKDAYKIISGGL
jgi:D-glycero-D-manno-heptose 1,7-bisphosphate phosphatase